MGLTRTVITFFIVLIYLESSSLSFIMVIMCLYVYVCVGITFTSLHPGLSNLLRCLLFLLVLIFFRTSRLITFYLTFEFSLVPITLIILLLGYQPEKLSSSLYILIYTVLCSLPFFLFVVFSCCDIHSGLCSARPILSSVLSLAFMVKSPLYCLHSWLPKAHVEAPLLGSMLLSGVLLKIGGYGFIILMPGDTSVFHFYIYLSLLGGLVCSLLSFSAWDMKSVVAYSSILHIGVVTLGTLSGLERGYWVASGMIIAHSLVSPILFSLSYLLYLSTSSRSFVHGLNSPCLSQLSIILALYCGLNFGLPPSLPF